MRNLARKSGQQEGTGPPTLLLLNARVLTMDPNQAGAQAVAMSGNTITAIGSSNELAALASPATHTMDCGGKLVSFDVESEDALLELQTRLNAAGVEVTPVIDHKIIHSIYFTDPNGIALEASVWIINPTGHDPDHGNADVFQDRDPVPALLEQMEQARLLKTS